MNNRRWHFKHSSIFNPYYIIVFLIFLSDLASPLQITSLVGPSTADPRYDQPQLTCYYQFGSEGLFTVKWYKDDREFYRYLPTFDPQIIRFPMDEVTLAEEGFVVTKTTLEKKVASPEICNTSSCSIRLLNLTSSSAGEYSCEISAERPYFNTEMKSFNLSLLAPPRNSPMIHSTSATYSIGDILSATCTSDASLPSSDIAWLINGEAPPRNAVMYTSDISQSDNRFNLGRSISQLDLRIEEEHFRLPKGQLNVTCLASLPETDIMRSSHVMFTLAGNQGMMNDNQKLEWNSGCGTIRSSFIIMLLSAMMIIAMRNFLDSSKNK